MRARWTFEALALTGLAALAGCAGGVGRSAVPPVAGHSVAGHSVAGYSVVGPVAGTSGDVLRLGGGPDVRFGRYVPDTGKDGDLLNITRGPDGQMWFTETTTGAIGRIDKKGKVTNYPVPTSYGVPVAITSGADGNLWFTYSGGSTQAFGRMSTSGKLTVFTYPVTYPVALGITAGPDGNVWFTDFDNNVVGKITPKGKITEMPFPNIGAPNGITTGPDGNLWICEEGALQGNHNVPGAIVKLTVAGKFTSYPLTPMDWTTAPEFITTGPDGNLWFTEQDRTGVPFHVEKITTAGAITSYALPASAEPTYQLTVGADANLWVTEELIWVDRVTTGGTITRYRMPQPPGTSLQAQPRGIASGPFEHLYFVETSTGSIGLLNP
jgi:streptogramin lyase